jgi:2-keto-4-pentenoate hydratase/2-oxohepta-3-ene-1,7-dioic acid hydratase in catechol pathway
MRFATISTAADPRPRPALLKGEHIHEITADSLLELIVSGTEAVRRAVDAAAWHAPLAPADVRWHAPIPSPGRNIFCLGLNYVAHAKESGRARGTETRIPTEPVFFTKAPSTANGPFDDVAIDAAVTAKVDWEVELGVIIGRRGRNIPRERARDHVFGYTAINDISARDLQTLHLQWFKGKSIDGFCPMGPMIVTADEFGDPQSKRLRLRVNGVDKQDSTTADMIFPIDQIIEWLSKGMTLQPGDIIATGTPEGVGMGRTPPEFLQAGDVVETEVEGIGIMRNRIVALENRYTTD